jgi:hypothetical protein
MPPNDWEAHLNRVANRRRWRLHQQNICSQLWDATRSGEVAGRRCERDGCRAWARRGGRLCAAHQRRPARGGAPLSGAASEAGEGRPALTRSRLETIVRQLEAGEADGLDGEIAALRLTLARLLRETEDPVRLADGVARAVGAILKAWQLEHQREETEGSLSEASARWLDGLGVGDGLGETAGKP